MDSKGLCVLFVILLITQSHSYRIKGPVPGLMICQNVAHGTKLPNNNDCGSFYVCTLGVAQLILCDEGLHFDRKVNVCNWPEYAECVLTPDPSPLAPSSTIENILNESNFKTEEYISTPVITLSTESLTSPLTTQYTEIQTTDVLTESATVPLTTQPEDNTASNQNLPPTPPSTEAHSSIAQPTEDPIQGANPSDDLELTTDATQIIDPTKSDSAPTAPIDVPSSSVTADTIPEETQTSILSSTHPSTEQPTDGTTSNSNLPAAPITTEPTSPSSDDLESSDPTNSDSSSTATSDDSLTSETDTTIPLDSVTLMLSSSETHTDPTTPSETPTTSAPEIPTTIATTSTTITTTTTSDDSLTTETATAIPLDSLTIILSSSETSTDTTTTTTLTTTSETTTTSAPETSTTIATTLTTITTTSTAAQTFPESESLGTTTLIEEVMPNNANNLFTDTTEINTEIPVKESTYPSVSNTSPTEPIDRDANADGTSPQPPSTENEDNATNLNTEPTESIAENAFKITDTTEAIYTTGEYLPTPPTPLTSSTTTRRPSPQPPTKPYVRPTPPKKKPILPPKLHDYDPNHIRCLHDGLYFLPHPTKCELYFICASRNLTMHHCGVGVHWDYLIEQCAISADSRCYFNDFEPVMQPTTTKQTTTTVVIPSPTPPMELLPKCPPYQSFIPYKRDCRKYYICIGGLPILTSCPDNLYWDSKGQFCGDSAKTECLMRQ